MMRNTMVHQVADIQISGDQDKLQTSIQCVEDKNGIRIYDVEVNSEAPVFPEPLSLEWKIPGIDVKGVWKPSSDFSKRIQADWELHHLESRISIDAPVISLFGNADVNVLTFACSNAINTLQMNARLREEDNCFYCHITFFTECERPVQQFRVQLRLDFRKVHFSDALRAVSQWWEGYETLQPTPVPAIAKTPLYSTWYQFHQHLDQDSLLRECEIASGLGFKTIIIDDGWQTQDGNRGYDYTGDWQPERIPDMAAYIAKIHATGMKVALWYSVPFCGKKSKAYQKFKGKFLTEDHRWAPVFDPRFPEVRSYLIDIYASALKKWNLDGFKLDFIDDFQLYKDTPLNQEDGRDYASINEAVDRLLTDVITTLKGINPDVFVEFRQKYTGPAMRKYGNMFRAFDCPGDATMNRVRIADIKMLCGTTAVHSDMVTWHPQEPVEIAALQVVSTLFGVPQLSILLQDAPATHKAMIAFYTQYWNTYASVLMEGDFLPSKPLANYPVKRATQDGHTIIGVYDTYIVPLEHANLRIDIINGQLTKEVVLKNSVALGSYSGIVYDCQGNIIAEKSIFLAKGIVAIAIPPCGMVQLSRQ